jgi:hypothetical protein
MPLLYVYDVGRHVEEPGTIAWLLCHLCTSSAAILLEDHLQKEIDEYDQHHGGDDPGKHRAA